MKIFKYRVAIFSKDPDRLANFYINYLGFKLIIKIDSNDDYGYSLELSKGYKIWIARHSQIKSNNKDSFRIMLSLYVDNISAFFNSIMKSKHIAIIEEPKTACKGILGEERLVGSFLDPDGNCIQLMELIK
ncbi:MAG: VOC family protein [bacterium]